jgi:hypothetical protein
VSRSSFEPLARLALCIEEYEEKLGVLRPSQIFLAAQNMGLYYAVERQGVKYFSMSASCK